MMYTYYMNKTTIKLGIREGEQPATVEGYEDTFRGIRLVAHRHHQYKTAWTVSEYYTGLNCTPGMNTYKTRKDAMSATIELFNGLDDEKMQIIKQGLPERAINK
jgi:hypothetical protein